MNQTRSGEIPNSGNRGASMERFVLAGGHPSVVWEKVRYRRVTVADG